MADVVEVHAKCGEELRAFLSRIWNSGTRSVGVHNGRRLHVTGDPFGDLIATHAEGEKLGRASALRDLAEPGELDASPAREVRPSRFEIALRFAVALAGGDWANHESRGVEGQIVAEWSLKYADAFLAELAKTPEVKG